MLTRISILIFSELFFILSHFNALLSHFLWETQRHKQVISLAYSTDYEKAMPLVCACISVMNCLSIIVRVNYFIAPLGVSVCQELWPRDLGLGQKPTHTYILPPECISPPMYFQGWSIGHLTHHFGDTVSVYFHQHTARQNSSSEYNLHGLDVMIRGQRIDKVRWVRRRNFPQRDQDLRPTWVNVKDNLLCDSHKIYIFDWSYVFNLT